MDKKHARWRKNCLNTFESLRIHNVQKLLFSLFCSHTSRAKFYAYNISNINSWTYLGSNFHKHYTWKNPIHNICNNAQAFIRRNVKTKLLNQIFPWICVFFQYVQAYEKVQHTSAWYFINDPWPFLVKTVLLLQSTYWILLFFSNHAIPTVFYASYVFNNLILSIPQIPGATCIVTHFWTPPRLILSTHTVATLPCLGQSSSCMQPYWSDSESRLYNYLM